MRLLQVLFMTIMSAFVPKVISASVPILDTIKIDFQDIEGRWIETNQEGGEKIYIFSNTSLKSLSTV